MATKSAGLLTRPLITARAAPTGRPPGHPAGWAAPKVSQTVLVQVWTSGRHVRESDPERRSG
jgi:hypothetical protein